ncbi:hypothetical protein BaRGS_00029461 [Batillaria attramentaria]|uniref:G-protein coupled receptors family 1 profile domain-containing protein n=1 Tax=Batillaria attramentaria TaxID=370345 RepID=A0ABD0JX47_9CAEN
MEPNITNTSNFNMTDGPVFTMPVYVLAWVTLANVLVFVTGVVGNTLVILVVTLVRDMKTATNLCLMNLSVADLLVLIICQPSALIELYAEEVWMLGAFMCEYILALIVFFYLRLCSRFRCAHEKTPGTDRWYPLEIDWP